MPYMKQAYNWWQHFRTSSETIKFIHRVNARLYYQLDIIYEVLELSQFPIFIIRREKKKY